MSEKKALVLSAGAMFGAYQVGVWQSLAGRFQPDVVIGVSIGAWNGWAIAAGYPPEKLAELWLDAEYSDVMRVRFPFPPWDGVFNSDRLAEAEALVLIEQKRASYARVIGTGANAKESGGQGLNDLRQLVKSKHGRDCVRAEAI